GPAAARLGADVAGGARLDLDEELLAEPFRQELADQTCDDVGCAARRLTDDDPHRTGRIGLPPCKGREHRNARRQMQEMSTWKPDHCSFPSVIRAMRDEHPICVR